MNLFRKKDPALIVQEANREEGDAEPMLARSLGPAQLVLLGIGVVIGAGLFSLTGKVAADYAGPGVVYSFIISAFACAMAGLCYAEFASTVPVAGSAYSYSYATMGELMAWIIGWDLVMEYAIGAATVAVSWSAYFMKFCQQMGIHYPVQYALSPFDSEKLADGTVIHGVANLPAAAIVVIMSLLLIRGTKESAWFNTIMVVIKLAIVFLVVGIGWQYMVAGNHQPMVPARATTVVHGHEMISYGWQGILTGAGLIFFAYIGFDAVSTAAQEARNPQRDIPIGILGSLVVCTIIYVLFSWVITGLAHYTEFQGVVDKLAPVSTALGKLPDGFHWLKQAIVPAILAGFSSVIMVLLMGQSRVFITMSRDGLLPRFFSEIHPRLKTPWKSNALFAVLIAAAVAFLPGNIFGEMCSVGTLLAFVLVCIGVIILRKNSPDLPRKFRCPFVPIVPLLGAATCLLMMAYLPHDTWIRLAIWMAIGLVIYFSYGRHGSKLDRQD